MRLHSAEGPRGGAAGARQKTGNRSRSANKKSAMRKKINDPASPPNLHGIEALLFEQKIWIENPAQRNGFTRLRLLREVAVPKPIEFNHGFPAASSGVQPAPRGSAFHSGRVQR